MGNWNKKLESADSYTEAEYQVIKPEPVEDPPLDIDWENEPMFSRKIGAVQLTVPIFNIHKI